jgi:hypothetical protein
MLCHVGINDQKQKTRIEELSCENVVGNRRKLFGESILSNPMNQINDDLFQNQI